MQDIAVRHPRFDQVPIVPTYLGVTAVLKGLNTMRQVHILVPTDSGGFIRLTSPPQRAQRRRTTYRPMNVYRKKIDTCYFWYRTAGKTVPAVPVEHVLLPYGHVNDGYITVDG